jgi:hypothetical protein
MPTFRISGVWKNSSNVITHFAVHAVQANGTTRASKTTKIQTIGLVEANGNVVTTWIWNYSNMYWMIGETVYVVNGQNGKYLRSNPDNQKTDNLGHLINFDWIAP